MTAPALARMMQRPSSTLVASLLLALLGATTCLADLANAWHIPDNTSDLGFHMRDPEFEVGPSSTVTFYQGVQKYNNPYGTANQTGGLLYFKGLGQSNWNSTPLQWYSNGQGGPNSQHWRASFNTGSFGTNEVLQYYFFLTFDWGAENTYLCGGDSGNRTTSSQSDAAAQPFTLRNRPAWLFHAGGRVVTPDAAANLYQVAFWLKTGYLGKDSSLGSLWADNAAIYYTTDGSAPAGSLGIGSDATLVAAMRPDHLEADPSPAGNAAWWRGSVTNLAAFTTIRYVIGAWHSSNQEEKFADYNAGSNHTMYTFSLGTLGDPVLTVGGLNADYTTTHLFVDELSGDSLSLTILFSPGVSNVETAEVFSNLNRRDRATQDANGDGIEDGIVSPDGNAIVAGDDSNYYRAYTMAPSGQPGQYALTLNAEKTGAYRLTARYRLSGPTSWLWYTSNGRRDHAIVVSPKKARDIILYEMNVLNLGSQGTLESQRSTFADLCGGPGARPYDPVSNRFNLAYARSLGVNWLWLQPIHPIGVDGRDNDPATGQPLEVGSPYSVKNFFQVNPLMSKTNTRAAALIEFTNFVAAADATGINVMLDAALNHTARDCELDAPGVGYFAPPENPGSWQPTDEIRSREARVYSLAANYCSRAGDANSIAVSPDRGDLGKWSGTSDVFFGRYAALVCVSPNDNGNFLNESDWFDTSTSTGSFDTITRNVWRYFSDYLLYWLDQTGCPAGTPAAQSSRGVDGVRADFAQGLPPQCWEYIVNKVRSRKWDFVFMAESLDGGPVGYRSNRHFDLLNENIVFGFKWASNAGDYRGLFEDRRNLYGQAALLLNTTSHDEEGYDDPFVALIRYAVASTIDGAPMIFYGQELGISRAFGFDRYELNAGKIIPDFKRFNSLQPIFATANRTFGLDQLWPVYAAVNQARISSPALRSSNCFFLNQTGSGGPQPNLHSVGKYEQAGTLPNLRDVVFAFVNLDRNHAQQGNFNVNISQNGSNLFGINPTRLYNVKNLAAYVALDSTRRDTWLIPGNVRGDHLLSDGLFVALNAVPVTDDAWSSAPFEAQYLKLCDVTPPPAPAPPSSPKPYSLSENVSFTWPAVSDPEGGISGYHLIVGTTPGGSNVFNAVLSDTCRTVTGSFGATLYAKVNARNNAGIEGPFSAVSDGTLLIATNSLLLEAASAPGAIVLSWPGSLGPYADLYDATNLSPPTTWSPVSDQPTLTNGQWTLTLPAGTGPARFYRLQLE